MTQDKLFLEENFNLHKSELDWLDIEITMAEHTINNCLAEQYNQHLIPSWESQLNTMKKIKKDILKLVELEKMYNIYQKTETDGKIIVGNMLNILGEDK